MDKKIRKQIIEYIKKNRLLIVLNPKSPKRDKIAMIELIWKEQRVG